MKLLRLPPTGDRRLWILALVAGVAGVLARFLGFEVAALWCFVVASIVVALLLPMPLALVSPLFAGLLGWLINMLPFVMLTGWAAVVGRWLWLLGKERRLPLGGRWIWLPIGLAFWTALGVVVVEADDVRHFFLLFAIQILSSATMLMAVDVMREQATRRQVAAGLVMFVVFMSGGALLEFVGVPIQEMQNDTATRQIEEAYGVDAFPNNVGMIKYARSKKSGGRELRNELSKLRERVREMPAFEVFLPSFKAFPRNLLVRFQGSAREFEKQLSKEEIVLLYDNVGLAPAMTVPRLRSFPRNALTYAGVTTAIAPLAFFFAWSSDRRKKLLGRLGIAAALFGVTLSLARGAWLALAIAVVYLAIDGALSSRHKLRALAALLIAAVAFTAFYIVKYEVDPLTARAGGDDSLAERSDVYQDTINSVQGKNLLVGFGTERPRGTSATRFIPKAGTHSTYLNYFFRAGIPGALAIIAIYGLALLHARAAAWHRLDEEGKTYASLLAAAVVAAAAHGFILSLYVEPIYTLVISLLLGLAMSEGFRLPGSVLTVRGDRTEARSAEATT